MPADLLPRKQLFRVAEVAELLTVSTSVIYRLIRVGELPADRYGAGMRISHSDLRRYIDGARIKVEVRP